jgi:hypothetical protein
VRIVSLGGGDKHNAIPRESEAVVAVPAGRLQVSVSVSVSVPVSVSVSVWVCLCVPVCVCVCVRYHPA